MHHLALAGLLVLPNAALPPAQLNHLQLEDVTRAIVAAHPEIAGAEVELPAAIATHETAPELKAGVVEHWAADGASFAHIRIWCAASTACRPFYAKVHFAAEQTAAASQKVLTPTENAVEILRPGAHAALLIDSGRIHLRIPVTCLGGGAPGAPIRVAGPKHARTYQATVIDGTTVRGVL